MEINIQFVKMPTSEYMEAFVGKELNKLAKKYDWILKANVSYKIHKDPKGKGKVCHIELSVPGPRIFAASDEASFEAATDASIQDLKKQLVKRKSGMKPYQ